MKMIVGLGNIGLKYNNTRHNMGFMAIDNFAKGQDINYKHQNEAMVGSLKYSNETILLVKPETYMNESGRAVGPLMTYYKLELDDLLVIYDDMDIPVGKLRLRMKGSSGGHNGIKSMISHLGTEKFNRLKIGIDRPNRESVINYVLGKFSDDQKLDLEKGLEKSIEILDLWIKEEITFEQLMSKFN